MIQHTMWKEFDTFRREMENVIRGLGDLPVEGAPFASWARGERHSDIRVHQDQEAVHVEAILPGVDPDHLALSIEDKILTVSGEKPSWAGSNDPLDEGDVCHHKERSTGAFKREVVLPVSVEADQATAEYKHGVLRVTLPKANRQQAKSIHISAA